MNAVATVSGVRVLFLVQQRGMPVATVAVAPAFGVSGWFQVTGFDSFHRFFFLSFYSSFSLVWPSVSSCPRELISGRSLR